MSSEPGQRGIDRGNPAGRPALIRAMIAAGISAQQAQAMLDVQDDARTLSARAASRVQALLDELDHDRQDPP